MLGPACQGRLRQSAEEGRLQAQRCGQRKSTYQSPPVAAAGTIGLRDRRECKPRGSIKGAAARGGYKSTLLKQPPPF